MAQPYCTGPVDLWAGLGSSSSPYFLGHGERGPKISIRRAWEQVFTDLSGTQIPYDFSYQGAEALITITLSRFNHDGYERIKNIIQYANAGNVVTLPGVDAAGSRGALMQLDGYTYPLWLNFPYSAKLAMKNAANGALVAGYRFISVILESPDDLDPLGTMPKKISLTWHAVNVFNPADGSFSLFDYNMSGIGLIN